ncbi:MAG: ATP-dependent sacrificial sulfur transferase LarE [Myxococcota bacterium]
MNVTNEDVLRALDPMLRERVESILDDMRAMPSLVVAFSGGVDSSVVAALAMLALGDRAHAATAVSETLGARELEEARELAREIGIHHELVAFRELDDPKFVENTPSRCFFCQSMRFDQMQRLAERLGCEVVASGSNASDVGDHRPGLEAMSQRRVYQPLLRHEIDKQGVRAIARALGLSVWDKPAKACLSSRIPHGLEVTEERLRRIERAEDVLEDLDFRIFRVRAHGDHARVELGGEELARALDDHALLRHIAERVRDTGFSQVSLDAVGYRSGSLNPVGRRGAERAS